MNNDFLSLVMRFSNYFHSWRIIRKSPHLWPKIVIHGNSCIILYISRAIAHEIPDTIVLHKTINMMSHDKKMHNITSGE